VDKRFSSLTGSPWFYRTVIPSRNVDVVMVAPKGLWQIGAGASLKLARGVPALLAVGK